MKWMDHYFRAAGGAGWRERIAFFLGHDSGAFSQFVKYGIAGGVATVVHITLFFMLGWRLLPALTEDDIMVRLLGVTPAAVEESRRAWNAAIATALAFVVANAVAYTLNVLFVFKSGRHHWLVEIGLFFAVSAVSVVVGTTLQSVLIVRYGLMTTIAFGTNIASALLLNYGLRKYIIFRRH